MAAPWRIGIDVGGTFTDGILWNGESGATYRTKVLTTPREPGIAVLEALDRLFADSGAAAGEVSYLVHGTTVATNAVLQHKLAATAFFTTRGFRDILEIARQVRADAYDVFAEKPPPLVRRTLCLEVDERLDADGGVVRPLDEASVEAAADRIAAAGVDAVAVCLLHAYRNPAHERRVAEILARRLNGAAIAVSSDLASEFREFPRACTTIINVGLMPEVRGYLGSIGDGLDRRGVSGARLVMQSNGGVTDFAVSAARPVFMIESGPAAGVVGAAHFAASLGEQDVIPFDMGGTTAKVGMVRDGEAHRVPEFEIGLDASRARAWNWGAAGYPILTPAIDLVEIGTGGGSLAWVDDGGQLRVGPSSAGAEPGPACYGRGGERPTITDADLVLGRLNPDYFLAGEMALDADAARAAVGALGARIDMDETRAAAAIVQIANAAMSQALRLVSVQRGYDPRDFKLVAFGGAGPLHAVAIAAEAGMDTVLVPPHPGLASAFGLLVADLKHDFAVTEVVRLAEASPDDLERACRGLEARGRGMLAAEGVTADRMRFERTVDLRYVGQSYNLTLALGGDALTRATLDELGRRFAALHAKTYGFAEADEPCELVHVRLTAVGRIAKPPIAQAAVAPAAAAAVRSVYFEKRGVLPTAVVARSSLRPGVPLRGPPSSRRRTPPPWSTPAGAATSPTSECWSSGASDPPPAACRC